MPRKERNQNPMHKIYQAQGEDLAKKRREEDQVQNDPNDRFYKIKADREAREAKNNRQSTDGTSIGQEETTGMTDAADPTLSPEDLDRELFGSPTPDRPRRRILPSPSPEKRNTKPRRPSDTLHSSHGGSSEEAERAKADRAFVLIFVRNLAKNDPFCEELARTVRDKKQQDSEKNGGDR